MKYQEYATITEAMRPKPGTPEWKEYWKKDIELSQQVTTYEIRNDEGEMQSYQRIPYGNEDDFPHPLVPRPPDLPSYAEIAEQHPCHDCSVVKGQLHVPGCGVEKCPRCRWQAISCGCAEEEEDESADPD